MSDCRHVISQQHTVISPRKLSFLSVICIVRGFIKYLKVASNSKSFEPKLNPWHNFKIVRTKNMRKGERKPEFYSYTCQRFSLKSCLLENIRVNRYPMVGWTIIMSMWLRWIKFIPWAFIWKRWSLNEKLGCKNKMASINNNSGIW